MKRKKYLISLLFLAIMLYLQGCGKIELSPKDVQIELGAAVSDSVLDYIETEQRNENEIKEMAELDTSAIDSMVVGEYEAEVFYKDQTIIIPVSVVDTTPPTVKQKEAVYQEREEIRIEDLVEVDDYSDVTISVQPNEDWQNGTSTVVMYQGKTFSIKAVDIYGNETVVDISPSVIADKEEVAEDRKFDNFSSADYKNMACVDEKTYLFIKEAYGKIDWYSDFEKGNEAEYEFYKKKYKELLENKVPLYDPEDNEELLLKEYLMYRGMLEKYNYYFFDMDCDDAPELCIKDYSLAAIIDYESDEDKFVLWGPYDYECSSGNVLMGSQAIKGNHLGANGIREFFYRLNKEGEIVCYIAFEERGEWDDNNEDWKNVYMMGLPQYDGSTEITEPEEIKAQGYYFTMEGRYYYRVTEEQFHQLTENFYQSVEEAEERSKAVAYTYEEIMEW